MKGGTAPVSVDNNNWEAECDARTLSDAEVIKGDSNRMKKAQVAAKKMVKEAEDKADALGKIAGSEHRGSGKSPAPKSSKPPAEPL